MTKDQKLLARIEREKKILHFVINKMVDSGFAIAVDNGGVDLELAPSLNKKAIYDACMATDEEHLLFCKQSNGVIEKRTFGEMFFVYGNDGWDVINDCTINLDQYLEQHL